MPSLQYWSWKCSAYSCPWLLANLPWVRTPVTVCSCRRSTSRNSCMPDSWDMKERGHQAPPALLLFSLALVGPTEFTSYAELAVSWRSWILPDSSPRGLLHPTDTSTDLAITGPAHSSTTPPNFTSSNILIGCWPRTELPEPGPAPARIVVVPARLRTSWRYKFFPYSTVCKWKIGQFLAQKPLFFF